MPSEDAAAFDQFAQRLHEEWQPVGAMEESLVDRAVATIWRLRRLLTVEVGLFREEGQRCLDDEVAGRAFWCDSQKSDAFTKLARYESALDRELHRTLNQLERRQAARLGHAVPPPMSLELTVSGAEELGGRMGRVAVLEELVDG